MITLPLLYKIRNTQLKVKKLSLHNIEIVSFQFIDQAVSLKRRHYYEGLQA